MIPIWFAAMLGVTPAEVERSENAVEGAIDALLDVGEQRLVALALVVAAREPDPSGASAEGTR